MGAARLVQVTVFVYSPGLARDCHPPGCVFRRSENSCMDDSAPLRLELEGRDGAVLRAVEYRHAGIDLFLDPAFHGQGLGTDAVRRVVRHLIEDRGHHRITIDPAVENTAAICAYEKAGFRPVGVMRRYERDVGGTGWHDGLLMELLADEAL
jgi:RimJ/RimL family protein N-acetyltransferase